MTDVEPYVADPREPRPAPRLVRMRPAVVAAIVVLLLASSVFLLIVDRAEQDPSLEVPGQLETNADLSWRWVMAER